MPKNHTEWIKCSNEFENLWHFPHTIGAIDGKHILIQCPFNSGAEFYNYKSQFSIVLLALVDAQYNFMYVHIGTQGRISDGGVLQGSGLKMMMDEKSLNLPDPVPLQNRDKLLPYYFLGDSAFSLGENLMKPYAGTHSKGSKERVFNYRLSRARRVVENAFGILASVFRILRKPFLLQPQKVETIVMTLVLLHNFLRRSSSCTVYTPQGSIDSENTENGEVIPGAWRNDTEGTSFHPLQIIPRRSAANYKENREELAHYFLNEGKIPWQDHYA